MVAKTMTGDGVMYGILVTLADTSTVTSLDFIPLVTGTLTCLDHMMSQYVTPLGYYQQEYIIEKRVSNFHIPYQK